MLYFLRTASFDRDLERLSARDQSRVEHALNILDSNCQHPSLHVKKLKGYVGIWEARASQDLRIVFQIRGKRDGIDICILLRVGQHDVLRAL